METATIAQMREAPMTRLDVEDFLFTEAALLDRRQFNEWLTLFTQDAIYEVPQAGSEDSTDSAEELFYVADDYQRLCYRVERLNKTANHSEWPASVCSRMVGNVRIVSVDDQGYHVESKFITHRSKNGITDLYCGHHLYVLRLIGGAIRIASKRSFLDMNSLRPQGKVTIIL